MWVWVSSERESPHKTTKAKLGGALRGDGSPLEPSHRPDEKEVSKAQARRGVEEGVVRAGLGLPAVDAVLRRTVGNYRPGSRCNAVSMIRTFA